MQAPRGEGHRKIFMAYVWFHVRNPSSSFVLALPVGKPVRLYCVVPKGSLKCGKNAFSQWWIENTTQYLRTFVVHLHQNISAG